MATSKFIFDTVAQRYIPNPAYDNDTAKVSPYDNEATDESSSIAVLPDEIDEIPGGTGNEELFPPNTFSVVEQITRNNPDGSTSVDIIIDVEDDGANKKYEVRVTR